MSATHSVVSELFLDTDNLTTVAETSSSSPKLGLKADQDCEKDNHYYIACSHQLDT